MTQTATLTQEDRNMQRLYRDLLEQGDISTIVNYSPLGEWRDIATDLYNAHVKQGPKGVRAYIANLQKQNSQAFSNLVLLTSRVTDIDIHETAEQAGILLSDVKPKKVNWLWFRRLALGKLSLLDGDPGLGKSTILLHIAACITCGWKLPFDDRPPAQGGVVIVSLEDGLEDTIQPRLAKAGADLTKIVSIGYIPTIDPGSGAEYERPFNLSQDMSLLQAAIDRINAKLVIIDPVMAVIGSKDTYKDNEVRAALAPLKAVAEQKNVSVAMIRHFTKNGGDHAIYRGGGSIAFIGLARTGLMVTRDPGDEKKCVLANIKNNLAPLATSIVYSVVHDEGDEDRPYINWEGESSYTVKELMSSNPTGANRQEILNLFREKGRPLSPAEVWKILAEDNPELKQDNVTTTMYRMKQAGQLVSPSRGLYIIPPSH